MQRYIGVKIVQAEPMTRGQYNAHRGWDCPKDENPDDAGYLVVYPDGYQSWCPKVQFEAANQHAEYLQFGHALEAARHGKKIARQGWNGKGQFVVAMPALKLPPFNSQEPGAKVNDRTAKHIGRDTPLDSQPYFALFNAQKQWVPGWVPSQGDLFAYDWMVVE